MALIHKDTRTIIKDRITGSTNTSRRNEGMITNTSNNPLTDHAQAMTALNLSETRIRKKNIRECVQWPALTFQAEVKV